MQREKYVRLLPCSGNLSDTTERTCHCVLLNGRRTGSGGGGGWVGYSIQSSLFFHTPQLIVQQITFRAVCMDDKEQRNLI